MANNITFQRGNDIYWTFDSDNRELIAGMLFVGWGILDDLNVDEEIRYTVVSNLNIDDFIRKSEVSEEEIRENMCSILPNDKYGIWLKGTRRFVYNLYGFSTAHFMQGVISMCHTLQVDFRNYILGYPFDETGKQYTLRDYNMTPHLLAQDAPDLDDEDEERADDENVIEPLARTDDIVVLNDHNIIE